MMTLSSGAVSGIRPYLMLFVLGIADRFGNIGSIPDVMGRTDVLVITGILLVVDFAADKIAYLDSLWDTIHTFVRPIAGGAIGFLLGGETSTTEALVLAFVGGFSALGVHAAKMGGRAVVNASPEPISNAVVSFGEDGLAVVLAILAVVFPVLAGIAAVVMIVVAIWAALKFYRMVRRLHARFFRRPVRPDVPLVSASTESAMLADGAAADGATDRYRRDHDSRYQSDRYRRD